MFRKRTIIAYLYPKNALHTTQISSFKYVFIFFFRKNQILKCSLYCNIDNMITDVMSLSYKILNESRLQVFTFSGKRKQHF